MIFFGGDEEGQKGTFSNQRKKEEEKRDKKKRKIFGSLSVELDVFPALDTASIVGSAPRSRGISFGITHLFPLVAHFLSAASWWWCGDAHTNFFVFVFSPQRFVRFCLFLRRDKN